MTQAEPGGYGTHATARRVPEPPKLTDNPGRGPFRRDRARVLHSAALRRLAAKTQVVEVGSGDFTRTRLTHSLECAQIGRELGDALGCDADLVDTACLAHDLGHPPFGHNGETALAEVAAGCGGFEGNAQSLRLLTRLEAKVPAAGLNLTRATLDATLKYPRTGSGAGKYGAYAADAEVFAWVRAGAPAGIPCLEAQVMDWADDVAYSVHDLEDGLHAGLITLAQLRDPAERAAAAKIAADHYLPAPASAADGSGILRGLGGPGALETLFGELMELNCWPDSYDGGRAAQAALKNLTSELIGRLCRAAQQATRRAGAPPLRRYGAGLAVPARARAECALLKAVTEMYVMRRDGAAQVQARERELIGELAAAIEAGAPATLDPVLRPDWAAAGSDEARLRVVVDQIASLTDVSAAAWHARLCRRTWPV